jgi:hypothetical protein
MGVAGLGVPARQVRRNFRQSQARSRSPMPLQPGFEARTTYRSSLPRIACEEKAVVSSRLRGKGGPSTGGEGRWTARKGMECLCISFVVCNDAYGGGQISGSERRNG